MARSDKPLVWLHGEVESPPFSCKAQATTMDTEKRARLEAQGWKVGGVDEFLELTPEESTLREIKLALAASLRQRRRGQMTQTQLAQRIASSQPRVARAERGDQSVSFDLLLRAMLATGATPQEIGKVIAEAAG